MSLRRSGVTFGGEPVTWSEWFDLSQTSWEICDGMAEEWRQEVRMDVE